MQLLRLGLKRGCGSSLVRQLLSQLLLEEREYTLSLEAAARGVEWLKKSGALGGPAGAGRLSVLKLTLAASLRGLGRVDEAKKTYASLAGTLTFDIISLHPYFEIKPFHQT